MTRMSLVPRKKGNESRNPIMARRPRRVALMLDLQWPYKRHAEVFAGVPRYAEERGWVSIIDEFTHDTLRPRRGAHDPYDGVVARAGHPLARRAAARGVPVVNVWPSSPARHLLPGVVPDSAEVGRLVAQHHLARGFRSFAALTSPKYADNEREVAEFERLVRVAGFGCPGGTDSPRPTRPRRAARPDGTADSRSGGRRCGSRRRGRRESRAPGPGSLQGAAPAEALDEHFLHHVAEFPERSRSAPAGREIGPDDAEVPPGQLLAVSGAAGRGGADDGPAGRFGGGHGSRRAAAGGEGACRTWR
jgi:hypothetical protein